MTLLSSNDLTAIRAEQTDALWDTCVVQTQTSAANSVGEMIETFTDGSAIACRFVPSPGSEVRRTDNTIVIMPALVRLPNGTAVTPNDRIKITKRYGATLTTALVFGVSDAGTQGPTCITVTLKDVD